MQHEATQGALAAQSLAWFLSTCQHAAPRCWERRGDARAPTCKAGMGQSHPPARAAPGTPGQALETSWAGKGISSSHGLTADGGARAGSGVRAGGAPHAKSATGGDMFADTNHRWEQCGREGDRGLRHAKPAIKYLP